MASLARFDDLERYEQNAVIMAVLSPAENGAFINTKDHPRFPLVAHASILDSGRVFLRTGMWYSEYCRWCSSGMAPSDYEVII